MYPVSDGFLRAVKSNTRKYYWTGTIVTRGGMTYEFGAKEIVKGSGYISRQCCGSTEIELGTVYAAEIDAMPNGGVTLSVYTENDIETCRDVLFYVAQVLGGFFIINREGKLELRKYGKDPVMKVEQRHRFSSSFSDFITRYTAVSSTNKQTQIAEYYALDPDNGLTMNLGVNPLLQFGLKETREMLCRNILADLSVIRYVPFDSDTIGNPALDPGDVLTFAGGQADVLGVRLGALVAAFRAGRALFTGTSSHVLFAPSLIYGRWPFRRHARGKCGWGRIRPACGQPCLR